MAEDIGGGLAGLAAAIKIAEAGGSVDLFSIVPVKRSHSVCAQGGINGAVNTKGEGDSTAIHFDDTVYGVALAHVDAPGEEQPLITNPTEVRDLAALGLLADLAQRRTPFGRGIRSGEDAASRLLDLARLKAALRPDTIERRAPLEA